MNTKITDYKKAIQNIRKHLENYLLKYNIKALIIGESGGIDSAIVTVLAKPVCQKLSVKLIGRSITIETNKQDEIDRGNEIGRLFCTDFRAIDLTNLYRITKNEIEEEPLDEINSEHDKKVRFGNIKVRLRMVYLYNLAQRYKGLVLSTDNYTELMEGFWTLHGDVGDYGMIQNLWKTEVYEMAKYLVAEELKTEAEKSALQMCVDANPTDGLGITNSDFDQLGAKNYYEVDSILQQYLTVKENCSDEIINHKVIKRHHASEFKRNNPFNITRGNILE